MFFIQALFLIAVVFGLGCLFGCWLKGRMGHGEHHSGSAGAVSREGAARTSTASELAAPTPHYEPSSTPQPAAALATKPAADTKADTPAAPAVAEAAPAVVKKTVKTKAAKSKTTKSAATKPAASKSSAAAAASKAVAKAKADTPAKAKPAAAKPAAAAKPMAAKTAAVKSTTAKPKAAVKPKAPKAKPVAAAVPDNLKQIKGVGPTIEAKLNAAGVNSFTQIAAWTKKEQADFAEQLSFAGRIEREDWVSQAKVLAKGGATDFSKRVAKGEVASSAASKPKRGGKA